MTTDLEKSLKSRFRALAKETGRDPADLWQNLILERFLVRLGQSNYREQFILKGAVLLSKYIELGRETRDLDFLAKGVSNRINDLLMVFEEVSRIELDDGFTFQNVKVDHVAHSHMHYSGAEVSAMVHFGQIRHKLSIDIGFGDIVKPVQYSIPLLKGSKGAIFESTVTLSCYPKEFIFAEKLETVVYRGFLNSRMKDFHDLYCLIMSEKAQPFQNLELIIRSVFEHRGTPLNIPVSYQSEELPHLKAFWQNYMRSLKRNETSPPENFEEVLQVINSELMVFAI